MDCSGEPRDGQAQSLSTRTPRSAVETVPRKHRKVLLAEEKASWRRCIKLGLEEWEGRDMRVNDPGQGNRTSREVGKLDRDGLVGA